MNFDKKINEILEGYGYRPTGSGQNRYDSQSYRKKHGADYDQDVRNVGGNSDSNLYWEITKPDGSKYYMTKEPKFKGKNVRGPFRGNPPR
jgi:hypothetical protein